MIHFCTLFRHADSNDAVAIFTSWKPSVSVAVRILHSITPLEKSSVGEQAFLQSEAFDVLIVDTVSGWRPSSSGRRQCQLYDPGLKRRLGAAPHQKRAGDRKIPSPFI